MTPVAVRITGFIAPSQGEQGAVKIYFDWYASSSSNGTRETCLASNITSDVPVAITSRLDSILGTATEVTIF